MRQLTGVLLVCCWGGFLLAGTTLQAESRPNFLVFITDDESWLERSAYGWSKLPTPALDRVARSGVLFTNGFTSTPSCAPSRAVLLTGRNFWELEQGAIIQAWVPQKFPYYTQILAKQGYFVGQTGKGWGPGVYLEKSHRSADLGKGYRNRAAEHNISGLTVLDYAASFRDFLADRPADQPFCFWAGIVEPHDPHDSQNYRRLTDEYQFPLEKVAVPGFMADTHDSRIERANFMYEVCHADRHLGEMLDQLEQAGQLDNTVVIVTSDNGTAIAKRSKASPYEWGVHEPLAIMCPQRIPAGRIVTDFVNFTDLAPTILDMAGIKPPSTMSGKSLRSLLTSTKTGRVEPDRNVLVTGLEWHGEFDPESFSHRTIRNDEYALIFRYDNSAAEQKQDQQQKPIPAASVELYDLKQDPWQLNNLADQPELTLVRNQLAKQLEQICLETADPRFTGEMQIFRETRQYVQQRKRDGYPR